MERKKRDDTAKVIASFNLDGDIKPLYVAVFDDSGREIAAKVLRSSLFDTRAEFGHKCNFYRCLCQVEDKKEEMLLKYYFDEHVWTIMRERKK